MRTMQGGLPMIGPQEAPKIPRVHVTETWCGWENRVSHLTAQNQRKLTMQNADLRGLHGFTHL